MEITLKNLKINLAFSRETTCFTADLIVNGIKVAYVYDEGNGGCINIQAISNEKSINELLKKAELFCKNLPPRKYDDDYFKGMELDMDLELFIVELVGKEEQKKLDSKFDSKLLKDMDKVICFRKKDAKDKSYTTINFKGVTIREMLTVPNGINAIKKSLENLKKENVIILNTNLQHLL